MVMMMRSVKILMDIFLIRLFQNANLLNSEMVVVMIMVCSGIQEANSK